jgi:hypothetical protein
MNLYDHFWNFYGIPLRNMRKGGGILILKTVVQMHVNHILNIDVENFWKKLFFRVGGAGKTFPCTAYRKLIFRVNRCRTNS